MADDTVPATTDGTSGEHELRIEIWPDDWAQYVGTAAQLQAEGLIAETFDWPRAAADKHWEANGFVYWLRRTRPAGHKGPMRSWIELDHWTLRVRVAGRDHGWRTRRELERRTDELRADIRRRTTLAGAAEESAKWRRYCATVEDQRFQAFKALVPALAPPQRRRKAKSSTCGANPG